MSGPSPAAAPVDAHAHAAIGAHLAPDAETLRHLQQVARGLESGDLIVRDARVLSLHTGEILARDVVVSGAFIAAVTPVGHFQKAIQELDANGAFLSPTFIDTHIHIEYSLLTPGEFARCVIPRGTGCVLADPNCIGNVLGASGMDWVGQTTTPLRSANRGLFWSRPVGWLSRTP